MFGGEEVAVTMLCEESMVGVMIDRFGKEVNKLQRKIQDRPLSPVSLHSQRKAPPFYPHGNVL